MIPANPLSNTFPAGFNSISYHFIAIEIVNLNVYEYVWFLATNVLKVLSKDIIEESLTLV